MAVKRDYSSFSKACQKHFSPLVSHLGFSSLGGVSFKRDRDGWADGVFLQQSQWGSGDFSMTAGFHVPKLQELWGLEPSFSLVGGGRVSATGVGDGDCWLPASDKEELLSSLATFAGYLERSMRFFDSIKNFADLLDLYKQKERIGNVAPSKASLVRQLPIANYGLLLVLAGRSKEAVGWITASTIGMREGGINKYTEPRVTALESVTARIQADEL